jgi:NADH-quinone oxidoreductase subunit M
MNAFALPWLELSVLLPLVGAVWVGLLRNPDAAFRRSLGVSGAALGGTLIAAVGYQVGQTPVGGPWDVWPRLGVRRLLTVDGLNAPLLPLVALLHFLTAVATTRTKSARFSFGWMQAGEAVRLAAFGCADPWPLVGLSCLSTLTPLLEQRSRGQPTRVYALHMGLFAVLLVAGWGCADGLFPGGVEGGAALVLAAVLVRTGAVPVHVWVPDLFEHCSFGTALMFVTPIAGVYLAVRLAVPVAPGWTLQGFGYVALFTAVYAAGMGAVQQEARRFFAYLFLSHAALVLVGLGLHTPLGLTGALALWVSVALSLTGLGLSLRAVESRVGPLSLTTFLGLFDQSPSLAICFMLTGLASVGFPCTLGYVATDLLVSGAVTANPWVGLAVVAAAALNGIAIVRAYFLVFTGRRHATGVSLSITRRERFAVLTLAALLIGGGLVPQFLVESRYRAAAQLLGEKSGTGEAGHH